MIHTDIIGREISVGDIVSAYYSKRLLVCKVTKLNPKMIQMQPFKIKYKINRYANEVTLLPIQDVTSYILKESD